jgi:hypothetical protein
VVFLLGRVDIEGRRSAFPWPGYFSSSVTSYVTQNTKRVKPASYSGTPGDGFKGQSRNILGGRKCENLKGKNKSSRPGAGVKASPARGPSRKAHHPGFKEFYAGFQPAPIFR